MGDIDFSKIDWQEEYRISYATPFLKKPKVTDELVIKWLKDLWAWASTATPNGGWKEADLAAVMIHCCGGFLAFGDISYLIPTLEQVVKHPNSLRKKPAANKLAMKQLVDWPENLSPLQDPVSALEWLKNSDARFKWDSGLRKFIRE